MLAVWIVTLGIAALTARALWLPLYTLLSELCGTEQRSRFWSVWSMAMIVLTPTLAVSMIDLGGSLVEVAQDTVLLTLGGIAVALIGMGYAVWTNTPGGGAFARDRGEAPARSGPWA
jgi:hypothetical protein